MEKVSIQKYLSEKKSIMNRQKYKEILHLHENEDYTEYRREDNKASFFEKRSGEQIEFWTSEESTRRICVGYEKLKELEKKEQLYRNRKRVIKRMYGLVYFFADSMLNEEEAGKSEEAAFEKESEENPDKLIIHLSTHESNANVMKQCLTDSRDIIKFLRNEKNDVEEWQLQGINAMFDSCNEENIVPYDLPWAIHGVLCMDSAAAESSADSVKEG